MIRASFVMPVMRPRWITEAVKSTLSQTIQDVEVLIGDATGCFDNNPLLKDARIKCVSSKGMNKSETLNQLIAMAQSDFILDAFDDDINLPNRVEVCLEGIRDCDIFCASYNRMNEEGVVYAKEEILPWNFDNYVYHGLNMPLMSGAYRKSTCPKWNPRVLHLDDYCFFLDAHEMGLRIKTSNNEVVMNMRYWGGQGSAENDKNRAQITADNLVLQEQFGIMVNR